MVWGRNACGPHDGRGLHATVHAETILTLQECINAPPTGLGAATQRVLAEAYIDVDGTIAGTDGECKGGIGLSYQGIWGYHPLVVSLPTPRSALSDQPSGNAVSHEERRRLD